MSLKNTPQRFGWPAIALHWISAFTVFGLFGLGWWMVQLDYYSDWYSTAPHWHKSVGIVLFTFTLLRIVWRLLNQQPTPLGSKLEQTIATLVHVSLYGLLLLIMSSGYLISTADGSNIEVFNWFTLPATLQGIDNQEDIAGAVHEYAAWTVIILALLHAAAALKHHVIDKDSTLKRMFGQT